MRLFLTGVTAVLLATNLASCSTMQDDEVRATATRFYAAYANNNGDAACDELAPKTKSELEQSAGMQCSEALLEEKVPKVSGPTKVHVFGTQAELKWGRNRLSRSLPWWVEGDGCRLHQGAGPPLRLPDLGRLR
jgi:hypothetical protein